MRTKALLLAAAIGAVSLGTAMAQVYSVNIVGYVNTTLPTGFVIIQNPLNASPNNNLETVIPTPAGFLTIYKYNQASGVYDIAIWDTDFQLWDNPTLSIAPGEGFFAYNPGTPYTLTFVGEVPTGTLTTPLFTGFNMVGSKVPQAGTLTELGYVPSATGEQVYKYNNTSGIYDIFNYDPDFQMWDPSEPSVGVGEAFWAYRSAGGSWNRTFNVN